MPIADLDEFEKARPKVRVFREQVRKETGPRSIQYSY